MPHVFALLEQDHRTVENLFDQFEQSGDVDIALTICGELTIHALLEEELVYPVLATKVGHDLADEARQQQDQGTNVIVQMESGSGQGEDGDGVEQQMKQDGEDHVQEEETEPLHRVGDA